MMKPHIAISLAAALVGLSCSSPSDNGLSTSTTGSVAPVVRGLRVTAPTGSRQVHLWGNPGYPNVYDSTTSGGGGGGIVVTPDGSNALALKNPYPNPATTEQNFSFVIPASKNVRAWVTQAYLSGDANNDAVSVAGGVVGGASLHVVRLLLPDATLQGGNYTFTWNCSDSYGVPLPAGFYRIYIAYGAELQWRDILIYRSLNDVPPDLRGLVAAW